jgi:hypothetical protein
MTFEGAIEAGYLHDNLQTRMLCGLPEPFGEVTDEMLERAKENVRDRLAVAGITERMDESLVLAKQRLGFRNIFFLSGRVNTRRPRGSAVPQELRSAAERHNRYDIELYGFARELFDDAPERRELAFHVELAALQAAKSEDPDRAPVPAPPPMFTGEERAWRLLVQMRTRILLLRREASRRARRARSSTLPPNKSQRRRSRQASVGAAATRPDGQ